MSNTATGAKTQDLAAIRKVQKFAGTPEQIARRCLAEAHNNPDRAIALAGRYARGGKLRATVAAIGTGLLRAPTLAGERAESN
jgi:hypothetical protein